MRKVLLVALSVLVIGFALPSTAVAGSLTLHPAGFGEKSRANWKAGAGEPDSTGDANQALYMQKMTTTTTFAAGVVLIKGVEGLTADQLTGLKWDHREDGHCGAGAPRWNVGVRDPLGNNQVVFLGCNAAAHAEAGTFSGHGWCTDTQPSPAAVIAAQVGAPANMITIRNLAIVFDEGNDTANPPPAGCAQEQLAGGFVFLDNITVTLNGTPHVWTSASDNGNQAYSPTFGASVAFADELVPTADILALLQEVVPGVALTDWVLYPDVEPADIVIPTGLP
jgi:hypothetical protein